VGARQSHSPEDGGDRPEGQYEKDPWHADAPHRGPDTGGDHGFGQGSLEPERRTERRRYPVGPKGYQRSDERLREDISERLMQAREIDSSDVTVAVSGAKLVLEGTVPERWMKHAIEDLADICPGLQDIENHIRVKR
jgi:osmotically-inducible protein OsmY